jgi:hypothetical protein
MLSNENSPREKFKVNKYSLHGRTFATMYKTGILILFCVLWTIGANAQSADSVYNQYLDFNLARFQGDQDQIMELGEKIIPNAAKLPEKARISFYFAVGKMYEDNDEANKALPYYEKVAAAVPNYYVAHRAIGYIYYDRSKTTADKINAAGSNKQASDSLTNAYHELIKKALPHLEKAQACDPSDETLAIIKDLYQKLNDQQGLSTLDDRLKQLAGNCIDILNDN